MRAGVPARHLTSTRAYRYLIPLAAFFPILPLLLAGPSCGHDFDFHIVSWLEAARQLAHGSYPEWAFTPAYNAGEPRFVFYPPLSWLLGSLLGLFLPWHYVPIAFTWVALTASGFTLYRFAVRYASAGAALLAATVYLANPYMLFTAYERTAYGELLAAAWIPLLLAAILARRVTVIAVAVPVALLWLTNAPAAVMGCYALALLAVVRLVGILGFRAEMQRIVTSAVESTATTPTVNNTFILPKPMQPPCELTTRTLLGLAFGLELAAIYLLPAIVERHLVQTTMATLPGMRIVDNTLFHNTADEAHDAVLHTASMLAVVLLGAVASLFAGVQGTRLRATRVPLAVLSMTIAFLLTPLSLPMWRCLPELVFLQFPWRLLAILAAVLALEVAVTLRGVSLKPVLLTALTLTGAATLTYPSYDHFQQICDAPDTVESRVAGFQPPAVGSEPTDEYTPAIADNDKLSQRNPGYWLGTKVDTKPPEDAKPGAVPMHFSVDAPTAEMLVLNLREYPLWTVLVNSRVAPVDAGGTRDDGLLTVPVPAGRSTVDLKLRHTWDQQVGLVVSLLALLAALLLGTRFLAKPGKVAS